MNTIKDRFKNVRLENELSQQQFADILNVSQNHISSLEKGRRALTIRITKDVSREFNINENWLMTGEGNKYNIKNNFNNNDNNIENLTQALATISLSDNSNLHELIINLSKMNKNRINFMYDIVKQLPSKPLDDRIFKLINQYISSLLKDK